MFNLWHWIPGINLWQSVLGLEGLTLNTCQFLTVYYFSLVGCTSYQHKASYAKFEISNNSPSHSYINDTYDTWPLSYRQFWLDWGSVNMKGYPHCLVLVSSKKGNEHDFTIEVNLTLGLRCIGIWQYPEHLFSPKQSSIISVGLFCNETIVQRYHSARADNNYFEQLKQLPRTPISDSRKNNKSSCVSWSCREQITRRKPKKNKQQGKHTREILRVVCDKVVQTDAINDDRMKINIVSIRKIYLIREGWETEVYLNEFLCLTAVSWQSSEVSGKTSDVRFSYFEVITDLNKNGI